MTSKQKKMIDFLYKEYLKVDPSGANAKRIKAKLSAMDNSQLEKFMNGLKNKTEMLDLECPNMKVNLQISDLLNGIESLGVELFSRLQLTDPIANRPYLTNEKFMVLTVPVRRAGMQSLRLKMNLSENDRHVDQATGQVIGDDKAAKVSFPEAHALNAKGLGVVLKEVMNVRGGNFHSWAQMKTLLEETGECNLSEIVPVSRTRSVVTTKNLMLGLHYDVNL